MDEVQLSLVEEIDRYYGTSLNSIISQVKGKNAQLIRVPINSPGGDAIEAFAIYNYLTGRASKVESHIIGSAMSAATVVALAAERVTMSELGYFMIHNPYTYAFGDAKELEKSMQVVQSVTDSIAAIYMKKTGKSAEEIKQMMDDETWMTSQEAKEAGFIDEITPGGEVLNFSKMDLSGFKNIPEKIRNLNKNSTKMNEEQFAAHKTDVLNEVSDKITELKNSIEQTIEDKLVKVDASEITNTVNAVMESKVIKMTESITESVKNAISEANKNQLDQFEDRVKAMEDKVRASEDKVIAGETSIANALKLIQPGAGNRTPGTPAENEFIKSAKAVSNKSKY